MTLLNDKPVKGLAWDFNKKKWVKAKWWYVLNADDSSVSCIVKFKDGFGYTGEVILEDRKGNIVAEGYNMGYSSQNDNFIKPYKYELQRHVRGL